MQEARARAWCRVDLAGGTLDIWPLGLLHAGPTVNVAVDVAVRVCLRRRDSGWSLRQGETRHEAGRPQELLADPATALVGEVIGALALPPVDVDLESDSPRGGGLGASSALTVALLAAGRRLLGLAEAPPRELAATARDLEARLMRLPTGTQDHYPALLGGVLVLEHLPGGERVRRLDLDLDRLGEALLVVYSGVSHFSAANNWQVIRGRLDGDPGITARFDAIAEVARSLVGALEAGDLEAAGRLLSAEWDERRNLAPEVSNETVERLLSAATEAGAWGAKACGAGGGGCLAVLVEPRRRRAVAEALAAAGGTLLPCRPVASPLFVEST
ncbi:MAG: hypothetical protein ACRD2Z_08505 [Thermoanaerobaculia bacterium]